MTVEEYRMQIGLCITAARIIADTDLPDILKRIELADSLGGIVDPTLWRDRRQAMEEDKRLVKAAFPLWKMAQELKLMQPKQEATEDGK